MSKPTAYERDEKILDLLDGNLPEYEQADLRDWLNLSPTHWERFAKLSFLHTQIAHQLNNQFTSDGVRLSALQAEPIQAEQPPIHLNASSALTKQQYIFALKYVLTHTFTPKRIAVLATAAAVLLGLVLTIGLMSGPDETDTQPIANAPEPTTPSNEPPTIKPTVATLTNTHNAKWSSPQAEGASAPGSHLSVGSPLHAGTRLTLTAGFAEITTHRGAIAIIEAPATVELLDSNAIRLNTGKLVGICETESSKGFLVRTPHMDITDLGTRFGVDAASPEATEVHVLEGEVQVALAHYQISGQHRAQTIPKGQACRVSYGSQGILAISMRSDHFANLTWLSKPTGTGVGLAVGQIDPNWRIVAIADELVEEPIPLSVVDDIDHTNRIGNDPATGQWVVLWHGAQSGAGDTSYTIEGTFFIHDDFVLDRDEVVLVYHIDDSLQALRLNGNIVFQPDSYEQSRTARLSVSRDREGLRHGINTLTLDIMNTAGTPVGLHLALITQSSR